jgi:hypothetical protein
MHIRDLKDNYENCEILSRFKNAYWKPSFGNSQDAPPLTNGLRKCGMSTQWNFMQP